MIINPPKVLPKNFKKALAMGEWPVFFSSFNDNKRQRQNIDFSFKNELISG
jgi:hypothetical protein